MQSQMNKLFFYRAKKNILECLVRETISQLNEANKQKSPTTEFVQDTGDSLKSMRSHIDQLTDEVRERDQLPPLNHMELIERRHNTMSNVRLDSMVYRKLDQLTARNHFLLNRPQTFKPKLATQRKN